MTSFIIIQHNVITIQWYTVDSVGIAERQTAEYCTKMYDFLLIATFSAVFYVAFKIWRYVYNLHR